MSVAAAFAKVAFGLLALAGPASAATLQQRIDAASPSTEVYVEPGVWPGPIRIDKPLRLIGKAGAEIRGSGAGRVVTISGSNITLQGFHISGSGTNLSEDEAAVYVTGNDVTIEDNRIDDSLHGIYLKKVSGARILRNIITGKTSLPAPAKLTATAIIADSAENCGTELNVNQRGNGIHLWNSNRNVIEDNRITDTRDGIYFSFTNKTRVRGNTIRRVRYGLHYMYSDNNTFEDNSFEDNAAGAAMMFSKNMVVRGNRFFANRGSRAYGLLLNSVDTTRIEKNELRANTVGIYLENCNSNVLSGNVVKRNYIGTRLTASSDDNVFSRNVFGGNMHPAELDGQGERNRWTAGGLGNHWQDSEVIDLNRDGIGDLPHREADVLGKLRRPFPLVGLLSGSPGIELLRFAHRHVALPDIPAIKDPAPLLPGFRAP
jgi:nitrous oxidase accessory protein